MGGGSPPVPDSDDRGSPSRTNGFAEDSFVSGYNTNGDSMRVPFASGSNSGMASSRTTRSIFGTRLALNLLGLAEEAEAAENARPHEEKGMVNGIQEQETLERTTQEFTDEVSQVDLTKLSLEDLMREVGWWRTMKIKTQKFAKDNWPLFIFCGLCGLALMFLGIFAFDPLSWQAWMAFAIVILLLALLMKSTIPTQVSMLLAVTAMLAFKIVTPSQALVGFSNDGVASVAVLFAVAEGVQRTSMLRPVFRFLLGKPKKLIWALIRLTLPVALVSAFLNNTPVIAMMIPIVKTWSRRAGFSASKLLMPLNDAALLGGTVTLLGTSTNLVVKGLADQANLEFNGEPVELNIFGITPVGLPTLCIGLVYIYLMSNILIKDRTESVTDVMNNPKEYTVALKVEAKSPIVGETLLEAGLRQLHGLYLVELTRDSGDVIPAPDPETTLEANDILLFAGVVDTVTELYHIPGLVPATAQTNKIKAMRHKRRLYEVVINPASFLVGLSVKESKFRSKFKAAIIAVHRQGEHVKEKIADIVLKGGDTLLIEASEEFVELHENDSNFALLNEVSGSQPPREDRFHMLICAFLVITMIAIVTANLMNLLTMALITSFLLIFTRCMTMANAASSVSIPVIMTIALSFGVSVGLANTGGATQLANFIVSVFSPIGTIGVLFGIYIGTVLLSSVITNNAAVALMFPIVADPETGIIVQQNLNPYAALYTMMLAASASLSTPIGYQTNLMVHGPGGYTFVDWVKFGVPLQILLCATSVPLCNVIWPSG
ncbi:hypothetical protein NDN08_002829 [Rhodosorus marinus]|uniref:RCK C-terminal domain-containing protein n=1 Tax=Rhodosorus marinus TaxID=101924 RepID=A0AAV8UUT3_9RHOD|nr:hypothetical protein NDN08_002829 [Rhodosorus marinus]